MPGKPWTEERGELARELGARIRAVREDESPYSLRQLAKILDIGPNALSAIETGSSMPDTETLMRIAACLGKSVDDLLPQDYETRLRPPVAVLEWFGRRAATFPASASASASGETASKGSAANSRRSSRSSETSDLNAARKKAATKRVGEQRKARSKRDGREGGI